MKKTATVSEREGGRGRGRGRERERERERNRSGLDISRRSKLSLLIEAACIIVLYFLTSRREEAADANRNLGIWLPDSWLSRVRIRSGYVKRPRWRKRDEENRTLIPLSTIALFADERDDPAAFAAID